MMNLFLGFGEKKAALLLEKDRFDVRYLKFFRAQRPV